ncbi:MAG: endonuclease Q family protein [Candidatus Pacebacteria bacterium]|nr:endonuclease Q family protein [Candidatus Paceibacterota bacterium]
MSFIADLHIHSHFSRATSRDCTLEGLYRWAQLKGVTVVGTGDCTHPDWFAELRETLTPCGNGLYKMKNDTAKIVDATIPESCRGPVYFMITGEISSIYKRDNQVRKVHSIILLPDLDSAETLNNKLDAVGNIRSDGRPILGLDPRVLLEMLLDINSDAFLIPAHIWTPWFSMLGSKSGFDSLEACFGDLSEHIFAVETGLSSDPPMNWRVSDLDKVALVSNSDLHSPSNLARNANVFHCDPGFTTIRTALQRKDSARFGGTIDMFPEAGKYHFDGHRKCTVCLEPEDSLAHSGMCPVCGKPLTLGVLHRVVALADRPKGTRPSGARPHEYIIGLADILAELYDCGAKTKKVGRAYHDLLASCGPELFILRQMALDNVQIDNMHPELPEAIFRLRNGNVCRTPGYDGAYGRITLFGNNETAGAGIS